MADIVRMIMDFESGRLDTEGVVSLFSELVKSGQAWSLQGAYGRQAARFIEMGILNRDGSINQERLDELMDEQY